jgi:hypothetical protein
MKKVLIVEDTQENLDAAKAFFKTISGFEFVYATNKEDAVVALAEADALITDRDMPYFDGAKVDYSPENGYMLGILAKMQGKPVIMLSEHGQLLISNVNNTTADFEAVKEVVEKLAQLKGIGPDDRWDNEELKPTFGKLIKICHQGENVYKFNYKNEVTGTKKDEIAWRTAWERLQEQF